jgi:LysR family glycine cleavage system transcriptional activator
VTVRHPNDLLAHPLILSTVNVVQWPKWFAANGVPLTPGIYALTFDRTYLALDAAGQGLGFALESAKLAETYLTRDQLVPVFADRKGVSVHAHHLVYPKAHGQWEKVERFVTWVREEARKPAATVAGSHRKPG